MRNGECCLKRENLVANTSLNVNETAFDVSLCILSRHIARLLDYYNSSDI